MNRKGRRRKEVNSHISLQAIKQYLLQGKYPNGCSPTDKRGIRKRSESFKLEGDDLYYIARPKRLDDEPVDPNPEDDRNNYRKAVLTVREQLSVTARAHVSESGHHKGTERTLHGVSSQYYWVGMSATARQVVKSCAICLARQDNCNFEPAVSKQVVTVVASANDTQPQVESHEMQFESNVKEELSSMTIEGGHATIEATDLPFTVTSEVDNLVEEDPDLNFDVGAIFNDGKNMIEECEILKAQRFWERVEILIISPTAENKKKKEDGRGRHKNYTIVALDSFSKWPEAKKLEKLNELSISQFIIQLISRFGIMNQLIILENDLLTEQSLIMSGIMQNLSMFDVNVMMEHYNPYNENWTRLSKCVSQFAQSYPSTWSSCLDLCLMPLRNSVAPLNDYTPTFVVTGREPRFPGFLFPHRDSSSSAETLLNQEQIEFAANCLMNSYLECCEPDVKRVITPMDSISVPLKLPNSAISVREDLSGVRRSGRKVTLSQRLVDYEHVVPSTVEQTDGDIDADIADYDNEKGEDIEQSVPLKKRKLADFANGLPKVPVSCNPGVRSTIGDGRSNASKKKCEGEEFLSKLDSCTFYQVLKLYIEKSQYPLNSPVTFKRVVRKAKDMYSLEDATLVYNHKNKKKTVLTTMKERLQVMDEIHTSVDDHVPRSKMLDLIDQRLVYWKNFGADIDAYVKACPDCKHGKARPRVKKRSGKKWQADEQDSDDENDWCVGEKYQGRVSSFFPDLIEFLDSGAAPSHLSRSELVIFKKKAKNFKLVRKELYYCPSSASSKIQIGRKVLANEDQRLKVMEKAHGALHNPPNVMLAELRKQYCWRPMRADIETYVGNCCQSEIETPKEKMDNELNQKLELFARHFRGEDISSMKIDLDSLFPDSGVEATNRESLDERTGKVSGLPEENQDIVFDDSTICHITNVVGSAADQTSSTSALPISDASQIAQDLDGATGELNSDGSSVPSIAVEESSLNAENEISDQITGIRVEVVDADKLSQSEEGIEEEAAEEEEDEEEFEKGDPFKLVEKLKASKKKPGVKIRCEVCKKIVRGENNFKEHMYKHNGIKPFSCEVCNKKLTSVKGMRMHMRKHTGHRPYLCNICGRGFPRSASLRYHIKTHDKGGAIPVFCDVCERVFTSEHRMKKHKRFKHPEKRPVWKCDTCGKHFTAKRSLKRHEEAHQGIRKYVCSFCNRSFFRKEYLTYHLDSHYKGNPDTAHLASKRKRRINPRPLPSKDDGASILSIYTTVEPVSMEEKIYTQLVEVSNPQGWTEEAADGPTVYTLDAGGTLQVSDGSTLQVGDGTTLQVSEVVEHPDSGTAVVMVDGGEVTTTTTTTADNHKQDMEISHIIMPSNINSQQQQQHEQQQTIADHSQLHTSLPSDQLHMQQTQNEITLTVANTPTTAPMHIEKIGIIDSNHHNIQEIVTTQYHQGELAAEVNQHELQQHQHIIQEHGQEQPPGTILATVTTSGASSSTDLNISSENSNNNRQIEVQMSNGQKLMLSRTNDGVVGGEVDAQGEEMVQYRVECLGGETITEEHLNAFRMLAQASSLLQP